jgi:hypothetical protein
MTYHHGIDGRCVLLINRRRLGPLQMNADTLLDR